MVKISIFQLSEWLPLNVYSEHLRTVLLSHKLCFFLRGRKETFHNQTKTKIGDLLCSCILVNNKLFIYQTNLLKPWVHGNCFTWPSGRSLSHFGIRMSRCRPLVTYHDLEAPTSQGWMTDRAHPFALSGV